MVFRNNLLMGAAGQGGGYEIDQSIRFDKTASSRLQLTQGTPDGTSWTLSWWMKRGKIDASEMWFINGGNAYPDYIRFETSEKIRFRIFSRSIDNTTTAVFRDPSAWYHFVANWNGSTGAYNLWQNNVSLISGTGSSGETYYNKSGEFFSLGSQGGGGNYYDGYLSEIVKLDNTVADATSFGEYNDDGVWVPKKYTGSYGTNGFYITGEDSADLGADYSGNSNDFTSSGLTSDDQVTDSPTLNFPVISPIDYQTGSNVTISDGNLTFQNANSGSANDARATFAVSSGKWYWEVEADSLGQSGVGREFIGVVSPEWRLDSGSAGSNFSQDSTGYAYNTVGQKLNNGSAASYGSALSAGDIVGVALDLDNGKIWWSVNGTFQASGNPAAGTSEAYSGLSGTFAPAFAVDYGTGTSRLIANFGQTGGLTYTPPTGFSQIDSSTLPTPTIADGSAYFQTSLYSGNSSTQEINQSGNSTFQPSWVWIKERNGTRVHTVYDEVRGVEKYLQTNEKDAESTSSASLTSFDADGFTVGSGPFVNNSGNTYAAWQWLAGNGTASNEDGSITSTVSANVDAGFSVIGYTGNETSGATIGHGLGAAPSVVITKSRSSSSYHWYVYHHLNGATKYMRLNDNSAAFTDSAAWNNTAPTSSVITLGNSSATNNTGTMIAYAFAEVEGFSKFGTYTGNGSTNGPFVYCGFKPAFVLVKRTNSADNWVTVDAGRNLYNVANLRLYPDTSNADLTSTTHDLLSNGFKLRASDGGVNGSGSTYIFMAFAKHPFGGDGVASVPAR